ncbi:uncharacterized protein LOC124161228 [Ischnura elegans]|uniref:uncharacterized protein LOC124161228 n=1 Tax=Ischnura elegans TaxID=197161 RepID=UPI001ED88766|nr:uncharacterized protein LOC124161228 [Ischnura elegans]
MGKIMFSIDDLEEVGPYRYYVNIWRERKEQPTIEPETLVKKKPRGSSRRLISRMRSSLCFLRRERPEVIEEKPAVAEMPLRSILKHSPTKYTPWPEISRSITPIGKETSV